MQDLLALEIWRCKYAFENKAKELYIVYIYMCVCVCVCVGECKEI